MENPWETEKRNCFPQSEAICPKCGHVVNYGEQMDFACPGCGAEYSFQEVAWRHYHFDRSGSVTGYSDIK